MQPMATTEAALRKRIALLFAEVGTADAAAELSPRDDVALDTLLAGAVARFAPGFAAPWFTQAINTYRRAHQLETREGPTGNWTTYQALLARDGTLWDEHRHKTKEAHLASVLACQPCSSDYENLSWTDGDCLVAKTYDAIVEHASSIVHIARVEAVAVKRRELDKLLSRHFVDDVLTPAGEVGPG
jgi:hypothetical protein